MSPWTVEAVATSSTVGAAALLAVRLLPHASSALRHWVLAVALGCALVAPALVVLVPPLVTLPISQRLQESSSGAAQQTTIRMRQQVPPTDARATASASAAAGMQIDVAAESPRGSGMRLLVIAWAVGSSAALGGLIIGLVRLRVLARGARPTASRLWHATADDVCRHYGIRRPVRLLYGPHPTWLVTWGLTRPTILLPAGADTWAPDRVRIVLLHELAHVARLDWVTLWLAHATCVVQWYNPLLWLAARRLRDEGERACDDLVLSSGVSGPDYAQHLLALARTLRTPRAPWLPASAMASSSTLERRVRAMLDHSSNHRQVSPSSRVVVLALAVALAVAVAGIRAQQFHSLTGLVLDPTNRILPNAVLTLTSDTSGARHEVRSSATGQFEFVGLPPASYRLEVSLPGFRTDTQEVSIVGTTDLRIELEVGSLEETIRVTEGPGASITPEESARRRARAAERFSALDAQWRARCEAGPQAAVGGAIRPPVKLVDAAPTYPARLSSAGIGGTVTMNAVIGTDGSVRDVMDVAGPDPELERAATDAVREWRFSPTLLNCEPISVEMHVTVTFGS